MPDTAIHLAKGAHHDDGTGDCDRCFIEWYNWLTRRQQTDDRPPGVSPVLHRFSMQLNDMLPEDTRQELARFLPNGADRLAGTESDGKDETRGYLALDWLVRTYLPAWLDLAGLADETAAVRDLAPVADTETIAAAGLVVRAVRDKAAAAGDAAGAAVWAAAGADAWAAAGDAARAAAGDAAGAAAGDDAGDDAGAAAGAAAGDDARDAARAAARTAARAAAWAAAGAAAGAAAWAAAGDAARAAAGAAAGDAARAKLAPVVIRLQASAIDLFERMLDA